MAVNDLMLPLPIPGFLEKVFREVFDAEGRVLETLESGSMDGPQPCLPQRGPDEASEGISPVRAKTGGVGLMLPDLTLFHLILAPIRKLAEAEKRELGRPGRPPR